MSKQYICPNCDHIMVLGTFKGLTTKKNSEGAFLKCSKCGKEGYFRELKTD